MNGSTRYFIGASHYISIVWLYAHETHAQGVYNLVKEFYAPLSGTTEAQLQMHSEATKKPPSLWVSGFIDCRN